MMTAAAHGSNLEESFDHDEEGKVFQNAEMRELTLVSMPRNRAHELDYHRPFIDEIKLRDTDGAPLTRVPDVFDCWYESGSMPYAEVHYPFEGTEEFDPTRKKGFPADFISESVDQTRGWFYSLMVLGVGLFGVTPYQHVITNGLVLAEDGKKMSKKLKNYPDPLDVVDNYGADTLRFYLLSSPIIKGEDLNFTERHVAELSRKNIGRLDNVLSFYELYKDSAPHSAEIAESPHILDIWIRARLSELVKEVTLGFEEYELDRASKPVTDFIDDLSTWYTRRSRDRFKSDDVSDRTYALATMRYVLCTLAHVIAPVMPFYSEYLFGRVRTEHDTASVHLSAWPEGGDIDAELIATMSLVRDFANAGLKLRTEHNIKVRQPLNTFTVGYNSEVPQYWDICKPILEDELNVKEAVLVRRVDLAESTYELDTTITETLRREGEARDFMRALQELRKASGLTPQDRIILRVYTNDYGRALLEDTTLSALIQETVQIDKIIFDAEASGTPVALASVGFSVHLVKVV
jgi:isoleucyl-tRNA synthetase